MTENMIAYGIWALVALLFIVLGVFCIVKANGGKPFGFWNNIPAPKAEDIRDVPAYNRAIGKLWIGAGATFLLIGLPLLMAGEDSPLILFSVLGAMLWAIAIILIYLYRIEGKYRVKAR